jgi:hypothetical protein
MSGVFAWSMKHGACILFALAVVMVVFSFVPLAFGVLTSGQGLSGFWQILALAVNSLSAAVLPFAGALLINRLDNRRELRA